MWKDFMSGFAQTLTLTAVLSALYLLAYPIIEMNTIDKC